MLSVIVPCKNEKDAVQPFYKELMNSLSFLNTNYELIFIDDGSTDNTLDEFKKVKEQDHNVKILSFSRNFGKEAAMLAGLRESKGDYVVIMDADLQDPPSLLKDMYEELQKGEYDCIGSRRVTRKGEPPIRSFFARCFYQLINKFIDTEIVDGARDFRMMNRNMVNAVLSITEYHRFSKGIFPWVGFKTKYIAYENVERVAGETKWSFWKLFKYAIEGIVSFSTFVLSIPFIFSLIIFIFEIVYLIICITTKFTNLSIIILVVSFFASIILLSIGFIGQYVGRTFVQSKDRPVYIIKNKF